MENPVTQGLLTQASQSSPEAIQSQMSQGTDTSGLLRGDSGFNQALSYGDEGLSKAIRARSSRQFNVDQSGLRNQMNLDARNEYFNRINTAQAMATDEAKANYEKQMIKYREKQAKRAARNAIIGSVLSTGGAVAGFMAGGPPGAIVGGAAGGAASGQAGK